MTALAFFMLSLLTQADPAPLVCDDVDLIAVAHLPDGSTQANFFARVQGSPTLLAHHWISGGEAVFRHRGAWAFSFYDSSEDCDRLVCAPVYVETWEREDIRGETSGQPWWRQLLECGLSSPKKQPKPQGD